MSVDLVALILLNSDHIYLRANLAAQRPIAKWSRVEEKKQNTKAMQFISFE
jgi:hypothetical protein